MFSMTPDDNVGSTTVSSWILSDGEGWDVQDLSEYLTDAEVNAIKQIPLAVSNHADLWRWKHTKNEEFSLRSAYHAETQRRSGSVETSMGEPQSQLCKKVWKAVVPDKVKNLVWRAINNGLSTMSKLARRGVPIQPVCPRCGEGEESVMHIFLSCNERSLIWRLSPTRLQGGEGDNNEFADWC